MIDKKTITAIEGAIYCSACIARLSRRTPEGLALRFPASHDEIAKSTCRGCSKPVRLREAGKIVKKEG